MKMTERSISVLTILLCAFWLVFTFQIPEATMPGAPGPRFFPYLIITILALLAGLHIALSYRKKPELKKIPDIEEAEAGEGEGCIDPADLLPNRRYVIFSFALIFFYILGIDFLGFYISTVPAVFLALHVAMKVKRAFALLGTAAISGSIFAVFTLILKLPLPRGLFW